MGKSTVSRLLVEWQVGVCGCGCSGPPSSYRFKKKTSSPILAPKIMDEKRTNSSKKPWPRWPSPAFQKKKDSRESHPPPGPPAVSKAKSFFGKKKGFLGRSMMSPLLFEKKYGNTNSMKILFVYAPKTPLYSTHKNAETPSLTSRLKKRFHLQMNIEEKLKKSPKKITRW